MRNTAVNINAAHINSISMGLAMIQNSNISLEPLGLRYLAFSPRLIIKPNSCRSLHASVLVMSRTEGHTSLVHMLGL